MAFLSHRALPCTPFFIPEPVAHLHHLQTKSMAIDPAVQVEVTAPGSIDCCFCLCFFFVQFAYRPSPLFFCQFVLKVVAGYSS